jgi:hypothetical protein
MGDADMTDVQQVLVDKLPAVVEVSLTLECETQILLPKHAKRFLVLSQEAVERLAPGIEAGENLPSPSVELDGFQLALLTQEILKRVHDATGPAAPA